MDLTSRLDVLRHSDVEARAALLSEIFSARFDGITTAPIVIESNVWIGANATITPGVRVGSGSLIAAGAVIAKDVSSNCVVSGTGHVKRRDLNRVSCPSLVVNA